MHFIKMGERADYLPDSLMAKPGGQLLLTDGTCYTFDVIELRFLYYDPPRTANPLIEVESLAYGSGKWMLRDQAFSIYFRKIEDEAFVRLNTARKQQGFAPIKLDEFAFEVSEEPRLHFHGRSEQEAAVARQINFEFFTESYARRWSLRKLLATCGDNEGLRREVRFAAWFEGNDAPVLLRSFQRRRLKAKKPNRPTRVKPISRFEGDFSVAIIVEQYGETTPLTIEPELQHLIRRIIENGGNMPRTKLRKEKSDTYQPEKLLQSTTALRLQCAGLLGKKKSGRTTTFWAKKCTE
jgi:hypothetical protein